MTDLQHPHGEAPADEAGSRFRPDLEGLRAVAVVLVLLYHAQIPGFGGGYVGVDVFFVLSGFLISGLIARELRATGTVALVAFYARRARRLLPAAALTIVVTVLLSAIFLPPLRVPDVAADGAAAALYSSNLRFAFEATDYLRANLDPSPLLHFWSLGVEEQFYLCWPALLLLVAGRGRWSMRRMAVLFAGVATGSFALSLVLTDIAEPWAFFSLPTRAWELAIGGLLALLAMNRFVVPARWAMASAVVGVGAIVLAGVAFETATPFPGVAALLPTLGAAAVIAAGLGRTPTGLSRLLATAPMRYVGRISYSLYLWHWPILVLPAAALETPLVLPVRVGLALLAVVVAAASQRWVEDPIRRGRFVGLLPRRNLALAGALTLSIALVSTGIGLGVGASPALAGIGGPTAPGGIGTVLGTPQAARSPGSTALAGSSTGPLPSATLPPTPGGPVPANLQPSLATARADLPPIYGDGCHLSFLDTQSGSCVFGDAHGSKTVILFGDSHAAQWFPTLERLALSNGWRLVSLTKSSCPAVDSTVWSSNLKRAYTECDTWRTNALDRIAAERPDLVVVSNSQYALAVNAGPATSAGPSAAWDAALGRTLARLRQLARNVVLIGDTPRPSVDPPVCVSAHLGDRLACATPLAQALDRASLNAEAQVSNQVGVVMVDPTPWVCPSSPCPVIIGQVLVYRDDQHMTATFAAALAPYLAPELPSLGP